MIERIDTNVGRLITYLDKAGLSENTVIIFTSENGYNSLQSYTSQLREAKGQIYEGGITVPAFINWKGTFKPAVRSENITVLDYFPTLLDLAEINDYKGQLDGDSILPIVRGGKEISADQRMLIWYIASTYKHAPCIMMKKGQMKYINFINSGKQELYNLTDDPTEQNNLASKMPKLASSFKQQMIHWVTTNKVALPKASKLMQ